MAYVKNRHGRIVEVSDDRAAYLLDPAPVLLTSKGKPKLDSDGEEIPVIKGEYEKGYTKPTKAEIDEYESGESEKRDRAEGVQAAQQAAADAAVEARMASHRASMKESAAVTTPKKKKAPAAKDEKPADEVKGDAVTLEVQVREAEGDRVKYEALSDEGKEMYLELFEEEPKA